MSANRLDRRFLLCDVYKLVRRSVRHDFGHTEYRVGMEGGPGSI